MATRDIDPGATPSSGEAFGGPGLNREGEFISPMDGCTFQSAEELQKHDDEIRLGGTAHQGGGGRALPGEAATGGSRMRDQVIRKARDGFEQVKEKTRATIGENRDRLATEVEGVARAMHRTADQLREEDRHELARWTDRMANRVESTSGFIRNKEMGDLVEEMQRLARRKPAVFVGSAFALGVIGARFFKSSERGGAATPDMRGA